MDLLELYKFAEAKDIYVNFVDLDCSESFTLNINFRGRQKFFIAIDQRRIKNRQDEKVKMSHELGHCETGSFYNEYSPCDNRGRHEERANRWAYQKLIIKEELDEAVENGLTEIWELADYFDVPEDFLKKAIEYYKIKA